ncbi:MAG: sigma factor [Acidobacteriota bacterium]
MSEQSTASQWDIVLVPLLNTTDTQETERLFEHLIYSYADPIIRRVIKRELHIWLEHSGQGYFRQYTTDTQDARDIYGDIIEKLLRHLRDFQANPQHKAISSFSNYVMVIAQHACYDYLRSKHPHRWRLKNRLRYLLTHQKVFSFWKASNGDLICGFSSWQHCQQPISLEEALARVSRSNSYCNDINLSETVTIVFQIVGAPLQWHDLIQILAELLRIEYQNVPIEDDKANTMKNYVPITDTKMDIITQVEQRAYLQQLWSEICQLPLQQRTALLLNLRDENGYGLALFPYRGIATIRQIAATLNIPAQQFAKMWNNLPLDDTTIAQHLGVMRQQVINLRKVARERLARRLRAFKEG